MKLLDFDQDAKRIPVRGYRGNAGRKQAYLKGGALWMVKFPQSTRELRGTHLPEYTTSPLSEYIGSQIYDAFGIPVHETVIGRCQGKIVVGCRDFTEHAELLEFAQIKNTMDEEHISGSYGSSARGERLSDVLRVIAEAEPFEGLRRKALERFWDMFVMDAFLLNNDRNNGNWGLLVGRYSVDLAPVYDNGNSLFNKRTDSVMNRRLEGSGLVEEDVRGGLSFFLDDQDHHIHPLELIGAREFPACTAALERFLERYDASAVEHILEEIPEEAFGMEVISGVKKEYYQRLLEVSFEKGIAPLWK